MFRCLTLVTTLFVLANVANGQQGSNIYLIKIFGCSHSPVERSQTAFKVQGVKGLVTALHGVADCQRIMASSKHGPLLDQALIIKKVDVDHDVALLSSSQIEGAGEDGLEVASNVAWASLKTVTVLGHPYGISSLETTLIVRNPPRVPLKDLVPSGPLSMLKIRRSPNHLIDVLSLQGNLLPGHSGAPVLNSSGQVIAVANGGLKEGFAGISWAVPYRDIDWDDVGSNLSSLAALNPNILFSSDASLSKPPDDETCGQLAQLTVESEKGFVAIVGEPLGKNPPRFRSKVDLTGSLVSWVYPDQTVGYNLYNSDRLELVQSQYYLWVSKVSACFPKWGRRESNTIEPKTVRSVFREDNTSPPIAVAYNVEPNRDFSVKYSLYLMVSTVEHGRLIYPD